MTAVARVCTRCVMDTTDAEITFDANGVCNHCHAYDAAIRQFVVSGDEGRRQLDAIVAQSPVHPAGTHANASVCADRSSSANVDAIDDPAGRALAPTSAGSQPSTSSLSAA